MEVLLLPNPGHKDNATRNNILGDSTQGGIDKLGGSI